MNSSPPTLLAKLSVEKEAPVQQPERVVLRIDTEAQRRCTNLARIYETFIPNDPGSACLVGVKPDGTIVCSNHDAGPCIDGVRQRVEKTQ